MIKLVLNGRKLLQIRTEKKMSRRVLGEQIGVDESVIRKYESGANLPRPHRIEKLCKALNIKSEELYFYDDIFTETEKIVCKSTNKLQHKETLIHWDNLELEILALANFNIENVLAVIKKYKRNFI